MNRSKLQAELGASIRRYFKIYVVVEDARPPWLISSLGGQLELDFFIEEINIAFEVQGEQHDRFVPHFHKDAKGFTDQQRRDSEKRYICERYAITLYEVRSEDELLNIFAFLDHKSIVIDKHRDFLHRRKTFAEQRLGKKLVHLDNLNSRIERYEHLLRSGPKGQQTEVYPKKLEQALIERAEFQRSIQRKMLGYYREFESLIAHERNGGTIEQYERNRTKGAS